jgi:two-component system OmpR family response regulator
MKVLIVEDEEALGNGLKFNFEQEGYDVVLAGDGPTALADFQADGNRIDLVILDLMLPGMSGYEICREIRTLDSNVPILVLSARTLSEDKVAAFDCGSDQYMTKPFALPELLSRARNLIERHTRQRETSPPDNSTNSANEGTFSFGDVKVDFSTFEVTNKDQTFTLTTMEQQLLRYFIQNDGQVLSRVRILEDVWGESADVTTRSIDYFVLRLRKIVEPDPANPCHILSVRGTGYRFVAGSDLD